MSLSQVMLAHFVFILCYQEYKIKNLRRLSNMKIIRFQKQIVYTNNLREDDTQVKFDLT